MLEQAVRPRCTALLSHSPVTDARQHTALDALKEGLARLIPAIWPTRKYRELLLDLGERKRWSDADEQAAVRELAAWLVRELRLLSPVQAHDRRRAFSSNVLRSTIEPIMVSRPAAAQHPGVARWLNAVAPVVGASPKALANSLSRGLAPHRPDHRWLLAIARAMTGELDTSAIAFHARTPANVSAALGRMIASGQPDAADATLLLSLIALWQRRRPSVVARGSRQRPTPRRTVPKPVVSLLGSNAAPGQIAHLFGLSREVREGGGAAIAQIAAEAALTEAHFGPHSARRSPAELPDAGEVWLAFVEREARDSSSALSIFDRGLLQVRVARQRAFVDGARQVAASDLITESPYVAGCVALEAHRAGEAQPEAAFSGDEAGLLMHLPALASAGLLAPPNPSLSG